MHDITVTYFAMTCTKQFRIEDLGTVRGYNPHTKTVMNRTLAAMDWEIMNHPQ
jgi:hypothetical protein